MNFILFRLKNMKKKVSVPGEAIALMQRVSDTIDFFEITLINLLRFVYHREGYWRLFIET